MTMTTERLAAPPSELRRVSPFALVRAASGEDDGWTLDGYAAVFNRPTVIDSWEGRFREEISPGAMKKSFRENPPRVQFDHGSHPLIGSIPIAALRDGYPREESDPVLAPDGGAHVIAPLHRNWLMEPVRDAIASGSVGGMSFRFRVVSEQWWTADGKRITDEGKLRELLRLALSDDVPDDGLPLRKLKELRVPELGPVVWPAYEETSVSVRSQVTIDLGRLTEPDTRRTLARAVLMADAAEASARDEGAPPSTILAATHAPESTDTPQATDARSAGEHESSPSRGQRPIDMWVRKARDVVLTLP